MVIRKEYTLFSLKARNDSEVAIGNTLEVWVVYSSIGYPSQYAKQKRSL